jgi:hypothetical protein
MSSTVKTSICSVINSVLDQKRTRALYNVPLPRLTPESPYPKYTKAQLDMRRKIEILKYNANSSSSMTNNLTKKQQWALLSRGGTGNFSQSQIRYYDKTKSSLCPDDDMLPTLSTACDIPGPAIVLQYDPAIPLYKYIGDSARTYNETVGNDFAQWKLYTKNEITFVENVLGKMTIFDDISSSIQTYSEDTGVLLVTDYISTSYITFGFSTPVAIWFTGVQHGVFDYYALEKYYDPNSNPTVDLDYKDRSFITAIANNEFINIHISNVKLSVFYNDTPISVNEPILTHNFIDVSFNVSSLEYQFYAIQYVGMLNVSNLILPTQSGFIYTIKIEFTYTYNLNTVSVLRAFQSGVFTNLSSQNQNVQVSCTLNSSPPDDYDVGDFIQYSSTLPTEDFLVV